MTPDGEPVEGALVWFDNRNLEPFGFPASGQSVQTDAAGRFSLSHPGYPPQVEDLYLHVFVEGYPINNVRFDAKGNEHLFVQLAEPVMIEGVVTDQSGAALGEVAIIAQPISVANHGGWPPRVISDSRLDVARSSPDGRFSVPAGPGRWSLAFALDGYLPTSRDGIDVDDRPVRVEVSMEAGRELRGRVVDADGKPVAGVEIFVAGSTIETDTGGGFVIRGLDEGRHLLMIHKDRLRLTREIELTGDLEVELPLPRLGIVHGIVRDASSGEPVEGSWVMIHVGDERHQFSSDMKTDASGRFSAPVPPGEVKITAAAADRVPHWAKPRRIEEGGNLGFEIELERGTRLRGRVIDEHGRPLRASIRIERDRHMLVRSHFYELTAATDEDGRYEIDNVASGTRKITFESRCCLTREIEHAFEDPEAIVDVVLEHGLSIGGSVRDQSGAPVAHAELAATPEDGDERGRRRFTRTDAEGRYLFEGLSRNQWSIVLNDRGYVSQPIVAGETTRDADLVVRPGAMIQGAIRGLETSGKVTVFRRDGDQLDAIAHTRIDRDGRYRLEGLPKGRVTLQLDLDLKASLTIGEVDVVPPHDYRVDFDLTAADRAQGRVLVNGEPLTSFRLLWQSEDGSRGSVWPRNEEKVVIPGLADGTYGAFISAGREFGSIRTRFAVSRGSFEISLEGGPLRIMLVDQQGRPVSGAEIRFRAAGRHPLLSGRYRTGTDGSVSLPFAPYGPLRARISAGDTVAQPAWQHGRATTEIRIEIADGGNE